jgi:glutathione S-transferase
MTCHCGGRRQPPGCRDRVLFDGVLAGSIRRLAARTDVRFACFWWDSWIRPSWRVAVSMTLLGRPFERDPSSVFSNFEDVSRINPLGRVPALVLDDGTVLLDSTAILDWLDSEVGPERALMPPGPARIACWRLVALGLGANEKLVAIVYEHLMRRADQRSANWIERCRGQMEGALAVLDDAAGDAGPWLLGDRLTQADITTMLGFSPLSSRRPASSRPMRRH